MRLLPKSSRALLRALPLAACSLLPLAAFAGLGTVAGCAAVEDESGTVELVAAASSALSTADVTKVEVVISGTGITTPIKQSLIRTLGVWRGTIGSIPVGTRTFVVTAYGSTGTALYTGRADNILISASKTTSVQVLLQQSTAPTPFANAAPVITSFVASTNAVAPGESVALQAAASDPNGDAITFLWTSTTGAFSTTTAGTTTWTAPATEGDGALTLTVADTKGAKITLTFTVNVSLSNARGAAAVTIDFNSAPVVESLVASRNPIAVGVPVGLTLRASDPDGDTLGYAWTSNCPGTFSPANSATPSFTLTSGAGKCTLTARVTDGRGGESSGSLDLWAGVAAPTNLAPSVDYTQQSTTLVPAGGTATFEFEATDPEGKPLSVSWTATRGTLAAPVTTLAADGGLLSRVVWTPPTTGGAAQIKATITDPDGGSTPLVFDVSAAASP